MTAQVFQFTTWTAVQTL